MKQFLFDVYLRSMAFGILAFSALWLIRRRSAAVQHSVAAIALFALLLIPVFRIGIPALQVPLLPAQSVTFDAKDPKTPMAEFGTIGSVGRTSDRPAEASVVDGWVAIWAIGVAFVIGRYLVGFVTLCRWVKCGRRVDAGTFGVPAIESASVSVPMTAWLGRHVVLLPTHWESWDEDRKTSVIEHELAHVVRRDWFTQLASQITCAFMWPNPLAWWFCRRCRCLAEHAADDMVLASGATSTTYAQDLLEIAREVKAAIGKHAVCMSQSIDVARRIEMILNTNTQRGKVTLASLVASGIGMIVLAAPIACMAVIRQNPIAPAPHVAKSSVPAQIEISVKVIAKNTSFASLGLIPPRSSASIKQQKAPEVVNMQISDAACKQLMEKLMEKPLIVSSPVIRTIDRQVATIRTFQDGKVQEDIEVTPRVNADGSITVYVSLKIGDGSTAFSESVVCRGKPGSVVVLGKPAASGKGGDLVALVSAKLIGDTTINPSPTQ